MADRPFSESELLIRVDERVEHLTRQFEELNRTLRMNMDDIRACHMSDMDELRKELEWVKKNMYMGFGAISLIVFLISVIGAVKSFL